MASELWKMKGRGMRRGTAAASGRFETESTAPELEVVIIIWGHSRHFWWVTDSGLFVGRGPRLPLGLVRTLMSPPFCPSCPPGFLGEAQNV